jgi:2'-hydroxyisoflavone reductase
VLAHYGQLKEACEEVVSEVFPESHTNVRAGLIVGPHDASGRFTYWPLRIAAGGEVLAPGSPTARRSSSTSATWARGW